MKETNEKIENNVVVLSGKVISKKISHEVYGESFYLFDLEVSRLSGKTDIIPIMVSERLENFEDIKEGMYIKMKGEFRSYNKHDGSKNLLILSVFVRKIEWVQEENLEEEENNSITLIGYTCKNVIYRKTPRNRDVSDILLAVNRAYGKSDYIPCIAWGRNAIWSSALQVGTKVEILGRIQSREYEKRISDTESEKRVTYEVSIIRIEKIDEE